MGGSAWEALPNKQARTNVGEVRVQEDQAGDQSHDGRNQRVQQQQRRVAHCKGERGSRGEKPAERRAAVGRRAGLGSTSCGGNSRVTIDQLQCSEVSAHAHQCR